MEQFGKRGTYRSNWKGPIPGCPTVERHRRKYCAGCHNADMRKRRKAVSLTPEQRLKDIARSYAGVYLRRGKITRSACVECGSEKSQMHHDDYSKPTEVTWLCRPCHMKFHASDSTGIPSA